ncbi:aminotransferase class V-fold PLP-dependent enzyme [Ohtaekwangia kribbensis]|jgi:selenocysteine lyase/cysteine desulfurase|uniref:Aminotransferase class V-fold PLP-dependent enzyme n=1 Tax=Ohtaekwangia kribbensis TaxID=688913 RepID=A0ABW3K1Z5_9BACT
MSPLLKRANEAGIEALQKRSHPWEIVTDDWFTPGETLRSLFARIIQADKDSIALIPSVSYGIAVAAKNIALRADQNIVLLDQQYPSNVYAWRELAHETKSKIITVTKRDDESWTDAILKHITVDTGLVAIPNCHWTDGSLIDLEVISKRTKAVNAKLVIDASQSLGAYPLNIQKIQPDFLVTVGYKWLMGPYGLGYLYAAPEYCRSGKPLEHSWLNKKDSENFTRLVDYQDEYKTGARRFDAGEFPNFNNIAMAIAALTQILDWGVENIQETLTVLTKKIESKALQKGLRVPPASMRANHLIGISFPFEQIPALSKRMADHKVYVSFRGEKIRVAPHLYNDEQDVERLFEAIG